jgi:hypothetical protein
MTIEAQLDRIIEILEGRAAAKPMQQETAAPKKVKALKPATADASPVVVAVPTAAAATGIAPATLDDVRVALVALSTRTGSKAKASEILEKYTPNATHVTGSLKAEDYARVVAECQTSG